MAERRVKVTLEADAGPMAAGFRRAKSEVDGFSDSVSRNRAAWDQIGDTALIAGGAMAAGLGLATKAAIDWETAWAGVTKTTDGTPEQMAALEGELRNLATTLPATHEEIAGVAEAAGQLGIARDDIADFTETAVALGESTNLSAEEAATGLAKISNVMGTEAEYGIEGIERMGSALVALGNDGASTESDILAMSQRLAGAGETIGASESDILAMANALSSVGVEAQLGGGAMSRALLEMDSAVKGGGDSLEEFARIAGMSASEFAAAWREDPIQATNSFIGGLGRIQSSGGDASAALDAVGLSGTQNAQVLLRAAGASDVMTDSLELGASAWKENSALQDEAQKRYETTASKLQIATNTMKDAAIDLGATFGPMLAEVADWAASAADAFVKLPGPVKDTVAALSGITAVGLLGGGGAIKLVGFARDLGDAIGSISGKADKTESSMSRTNRTMRGMARWGMYAAGAAAVATGIGKIADSTVGAPASIEDATAALLNLQDQSKGSTKDLDALFTELDTGGNIMGNWSVQVDGAADAYRRLNDPSVKEQLEGVSGIMPGLTSKTDQLKNTFEATGQALAGMPADEAAASFDALVQELGGGADVQQRLLELMPAYREQLQGSENDARMAGEGAAAMGGDLESMAGEAMSAEQQIDGLAESIEGLGDAILAQSDAQIGYQQALDDATRAAQENGRTLDTNYESGRANQSALNDLAQSAKDYAVATLEQTGSLSEAQGVLSSARGQYIRMGQAMGLSKTEATQLADQILKLPEDAVTQYTSKGAGKAKSDAKGVSDAVNSTPDSKSIQIVTKGTVPSRIDVMSLSDVITNLNGKSVTVKEAGSNTSTQRVRILNGSILGLSDKAVQVTELGSNAAGERVVRFGDKVYAVPNSKVVAVTEYGSDASASRVANMDAQIRLLNGKTVSVSEIGASTARGRILEMDGAIFGLDGKTVQVNEIGATASGARVVELDGEIYRLHGKSVDVTANVYGQGAVNHLGTSIAGIRSKTVQIQAVMKKSGSWGTGPTMADGGMLAGGPGGVVQAFAGGGYAGTLGGAQPQVRAAGGSGVLWAEEGAGPWEAFISGHPGKKSRSLAILDDVATRLGQSVVPAATRYADGGMHTARHYTPARPAAGVSVQAPATTYVGPSSGDIAEAVGSQLSRMSVVTNISGRQFHGVIRRDGFERTGR